MKTLEISQPIETVRDHWGKAENLKKFFPSITEIRTFSETNWLWSAEIGGITKRWMTAVITTENSIEWKPTDGSENAGRVVFEETDEGTKIKLDLDFDDSIWTSDVHRSKNQKGWRTRQSLEAYEAFVDDGEIREDGFRLEPERIELEGMTRPELYEMASERNLAGRSKMRKSELIEALLPVVSE